MTPSLCMNVSEFACVLGLRVKRENRSTDPWEQVQRMQTLDRSCFQHRLISWKRDPSLNHATIPRPLRHRYWYRGINVGESGKAIKEVFDGSCWKSLCCVATGLQHRASIKSTMAIKSDVCWVPVLQVTICQSETAGFTDTGKRRKEEKQH